MSYLSNPGSISDATLDSTKYRYAITIKKNTNDVQGSWADLNYVADGLPYPVVRRRYEVDPHHKLHMHAIIINSSKVSYKKCQRKGWNIYIRKANNLPNWKAYCDKDSHGSPFLQQQIVDSHYFKYIWDF